MSNLTKIEVSQWIRDLIPYIQNPMILAPKGCIISDQNAEPRKVIEYDTCLIPQEPQIISQTENLKMLVELYKAVQNG